MTLNPDSHAALQAIADIRAFCRVIKQTEIKLSPLELERLNKDWRKKYQEVNSIPITGEQRDIALAAWESAIESKNFQTLTRREIRILCSIHSVTKAEEFKLLLQNRIHDFQSSMILVLMKTFHDTWESNQNHEAIRKFLQSYLNQFSGRNSKLLNWKTYEELLLSSNGPIKLANELVTIRCSIDELGEHYYFAPNSLFGESIKHQVSEALIQILKEQLRNNIFASEDWQYLFNDYIQSTQFELLGQLIIAVENVQIEDSKRRGMAFLQDWFLSHKHYGDPRVNPGGWTSISNEARNIFTGWLAQEDIRLFFEIIIQNDTQGRKRFWEPYLNKIKGSVIAIGNNVRRARLPELENLRKQSYFFALLEGEKNNAAFILDFGDYIVVDFSTSGRAYLYKKTVFLDRQNNAQSIYRDSRGKTLNYFNVRNLKDSRIPEYALEYEVHIPPRWLQNLANKLAKYGIRP